MVEHDRREIQKLLKLFDETIDTYYEEELEKLRALVENWIDETIQGKRPEFKDIKNLLTQLERSKILRSSLIRFETILKDIQENRIRIDNAIRPMAFIFEGSNNAEEQLRHLNHMLRMEMIDEEQHAALLKEEELDLDKFIKHLKEVKVVRGLKFLPRLTDGLFNKLEDWLESFKEKKTRQLKEKLNAVLDELLQRRAISKQEHKDKIEQHDLDQ